MLSFPRSDNLEVENNERGQRPNSRPEKAANERPQMVGHNGEVAPFPIIRPLHFNGSSLVLRSIDFFLQLF